MARIGLRALQHRGYWNAKNIRRFLGDPAGETPERWWWIADVVEAERSDDWWLMLAERGATGFVPEPVAVSEVSRLELKERRRAERLAERERRRKVLAGVESRVRVRRRVDPGRVVAHVGSTNSGKTTVALQRMVDTVILDDGCVGRGWFAAPLRLLAQEAAVTVAGWLGQRDLMLEALVSGVAPEGLLVGVVTGEEQINAAAPVVCATPEMVASGPDDVLVVDEAHWVTDRDRGWAWAELLLAAECSELHVVGDRAVLPVLEDVFPMLEVWPYDRRSPVEFVGARDVADLPARSVVVAFSRKSVLGLVGELRRRGRRVAGLYGALPPVTRRQVIDEFQSGRVDVLVATDVIGHGLNLDVDEVCFAEAVKFDGERRRRLARWEAGQIAGRAGRDRNAGRVSYLRGVRWLSQHADAKWAAEQGALAAMSGSSSMRVDTLFVKPRLSHFEGVESLWLSDVPGLLDAWSAAIRDAGWTRVRPMPTDRLVSVFRQVCQLADPADDRLPDVWRLMMLPVDSDGRMFEQVVRAVLCGGRVVVPALQQGSLEAAETAVRAVRDLRAATVAFGEVFGSMVDAVELARLEARQAEVISAMLASDRLEVSTVCSCGRVKPPWFRLCDDCHRPWASDVEVAGWR